MIDLYYWPTPNGWKITIFCEEADVPYRIVPVDIGKGEQFEPSFLEISPNNRMPAIVDPDGPDGRSISIFESGAILIYLGEKHGAFLPKDTRRKSDVIQWLMFQMGNVGPMFGQAGHFRRYAPEKIDYAIGRYTKESQRLCRVLDRRLADREFVAGEYSIADMATWPWIHAARDHLDFDDVPDMKRWYDRILERPAVVRGIGVLKDARRSNELTDEVRSVLFGDRQFERRT